MKKDFFFYILICLKDKSSIMYILVLFFRYICMQLVRTLIMIGRLKLIYYRVNSICNFFFYISRYRYINEWRTRLFFTTHISNINKNLYKYNINLYSLNS